MDCKIDPRQYIKQLDSASDDSICLAYAALGFATMGAKPMRFYTQHLDELVAATDAYYRNIDGPIQLLQDYGDAHKQLHCLQSIIFEQFQYHGNRESYDELENADLCAVIDRRKGMPIAISIICIHVANALGWNVSGIAMPGHFLCRLEANGERIVFDPFNKAKPLDAPELRALIKQALGPEAELQSQYYESVSNRMVLLRLQNNIKLRQVENREYIDALLTLKTMRKIAPDEASLLLDSGQLYALSDQPKAAVDMLNTYLKLAPAGYDRSRAEILLQSLKKQLN